jgi:protease I
MPTRRRLKGRTIAALAADGFEKVELVIPLRALKATGAKVDVVSLRRGRIRGVNLHMPASRVRVDKTVDEANPADHDGLLLPGGFINPDLLRQSAPARGFVRAFAAASPSRPSVMDRGCSHQRDSWTDEPSPPGRGSATTW